MNRRKGTQLLIFTCLGVHRKEVKLKEVAVFRVLYAILTKKKVGGLGLSGMINHMEVTRKYMGERMKGANYFSKICLYKPHPHQGKAMPCIGQMRAGRGLFLHLLILSYLQLKITFTPKWWPVLGRHILIPSCSAVKFYTYKLYTYNS